MVCKRWRKYFKYKYDLTKLVKGNELTFTNYVDKPKSRKNSTFIFLNKSINYTERPINWNEISNGLLWAYNLNYMDYLLQPGLRREEGVHLIQDFIIQLLNNDIGLDPYPISLRGINWVKFISKNNVQDHKIDSSLYAQYQTLSGNIEYHLLGNHLLENGFSLLFGAFYFRDLKLYRKSFKIINNELEEQILTDGGHFELSPMYHQIILDRLLDCINLLQNNDWLAEQKQLLTLCKKKASLMLGWLNAMTFKNGDIPLFNDSTVDIAPSSKDLIGYAARLGLQPTTVKLSESGYRKYLNKNYECTVDVGPIGPDYIPGHAHADMLSFVLYHKNKPLIVDMGISTYDKNKKRNLERSTISHNTVVIDNKNQSDVWGGFRIGKRAAINVLTDEPDKIEAEHNGYNPIIHKRKFVFKDSTFSISDKLSSNGVEAKAFFHFAKERSVKIVEDKIWVDDEPMIEIFNANDITIESYQLPQGYNTFLDAQKITVFFETDLEVRFNLN